MSHTDNVEAPVAQTSVLESKWHVVPDSRPSDYICALMSLHAYQGESLHIGGHLPDYADWEIIDIKSSDGGYFGLLYFNKKENHYVLCHRGTNTLAAWIEDFHGVYLGKISPQKRAAYEFVKDTVTRILRVQTNLSFTGHSLGAFLAELSVFYCHRSFSFPRVNAVTFESPGSYETLISMQTNIQGQEIDVSHLDIVEYLSYPNLINTCNHHIGTLYQLDPDLGKWGWINGWFTKQAHSMQSIIETFSEEARPPQAKYLLDWPMGTQSTVFYTDARFKDGQYNQDLVDQQGHKLFKLEYEAHYSIDQSLSKRNVLPLRNFNLELQNFILGFYQWRKGFDNINTMNERLRGIKPESIRKQLLDYTVSERENCVKKDRAVMVKLSKEDRDITNFRKDISVWLSRADKDMEVFELMRKNASNQSTLEVISVLAGEGSRVGTIKGSKAIATKVAIPQDASQQDIINAKELIQQYQDYGGRFVARAFESGSDVKNAENVESIGMLIQVENSSSSLTELKTERVESKKKQVIGFPMTSN